MSKLVPLSRLQFEIPPKPSQDLGKVGYFAMIDLDKLMVDETYQRPIEAAGKKNIRHIIEEFHWTKFGPLIVSPRHGGVFAIIDGQHHAVAALMHGAIKAVPCWVLTCTPEEEARAFSTINGIVTRVHPQYLFRARIASGDAGAVAADEAARSAGAVIMAYPKAAHQLKVGETLAGKTIETALGRYGRDVVVTAMELITRTGNGNPGFMKGDLIEGFAYTLFTHPKWNARKDQVRAAVEAKGVREIFGAAVRKVAAGVGLTMKSQISAVLAGLLETQVGDGGRASSPAKTLVEEARVQARRDLVPSQPTKPPAPRMPSASTIGRQKFEPIDNRGNHTAELLGDPAPGRGAADLDDRGKFKVTTYLIRKGHTASAQGQGFRIDGRYYDREEAIELVNSHRAKAELPPIKVSEAA